MTFRQQKIRAPKEHGEILLVPTAAQVESLLAHNRKTIDLHNFSVAGVPIERLKSQARGELLSFAQKYTRQYRDVDVKKTEAGKSGIVLSGHQPELFHAGVWFKNFVLSELGQQYDCVAINLIIDNDLCGITKINVPAGSSTAPTIKRVPYDQGGRNIPFEHRLIEDRDVFERFGHQVAENIAPFVDEPLIADLWPKVIEGARQTGLLGHAIAQGRHSIEESFGLKSLEIPLSQVCSGDSFASFATEIITGIGEFQANYNQTIRDYRLINGIKSAARPVPELRAFDRYHETPFWIWAKAKPVRRPLFVKQVEKNIELNDLNGFSTRIPSGQLKDAIRFFESDMAIRPRALLTTMYSRLVLSDLFIHGIGGAKYDELTDEIARRFFGVQLPQHITATATMKLTPDSPGNDNDDPTSYANCLREMDYHAEKYIEQSGEFLEQTVAEKRNLISKLNGARPQNGSRKLWQQQMEQVNLRLREAVAEKRALLEADKTLADERTRRARVLASREFSFCLFASSLGNELQQMVGH